jgi:hypothetical protein
VYADNPIGTVADFAAAGAFLMTLLALILNGARNLERWISLGVAAGGMVGLVAVSVDALS